MEILLSSGILGRNRRLVFNDHSIAYETGNEVGEAYAKMPLADIAAVRYGYENLVFYRFRFGTRYQIELKDHQGKQLAIKFRSHLFNTDTTSQVYLSILDQLWASVLDGKVQHLFTQWQAGQTIRIGNVTVTPEGVYLEKKEQLIPWSSCSLRESFHYFSVNSTSNPKTYTNVYYLKEWDGVVLFALLEMILENKMHNETG